MVRGSARASRDRRRFLDLTATLLLPGMAGCAGGGQGGEDGSTPETEEERITGDEATTNAPDSSGTGFEETTTTDGLDLREANVVGVEVETRDDAYRFSVALYHDDDGEDGYADWWQVETVEGDRLGRRELLHAHGTTPFTRSETIEDPTGGACVVVRGHDQTHGYGGQAMLVNVETGATRAVQQGADRRTLESGDCP